jgi:hypothetical protein
MPNAGQKYHIRIQHALMNSFVLGSYLFVRHWHCACILILQRGGRQLVAETDSAANQFGAPESVEDPRGNFRCFWPVSAPRAVVRSLNRRAIMKAIDTLPGESNTSIISSIINLVCPQCGGRMSEFQCEGRCRRNWLAEWEWANQATRSHRGKPLGRAGRAIR